MASHSPRTILLLDADTERRSETAHTLLNHGLSVLVAADVKTAQGLVRHHRPSAILMDASFLSRSDLREKLYIHGLNVDTPFVVLADDSEPLAETDVPFGVISRPLTEAGIHSLLAIQGLPIAGEEPPTISQRPEQPSLLYALPHEYRTPLTDIIGQASFLHGHARSTDPGEIREVSAEILSAARRLLRVTDNFLMYAQIETLAESPLHVDRMRQVTTREPASVMYDTIVQRAMAHERRNDVSMALDIEGVGVTMMEQHLDKVTSELIDNALYFSRPGTPVTVNATPDGGRCDLHDPRPRRWYARTGTHPDRSLSSVPQKKSGTTRHRTWSGHRKAISRIARWYVHGILCTRNGYQCDIHHTTCQRGSIEGNLNSPSPLSPFSITSPTTPLKGGGGLFFRLSAGRQGDRANRRCP